MTTSTILAAEAAFDEFCRQCDFVVQQLEQELAERRAEIVEFDELLVRRTRTINAGSAFLFAAKLAADDTGRDSTATVLDLMRPDEIGRRRSLQ